MNEGQKRFGNIQKVAIFFCIKSSLQFVLIYALFVEIPRYLEIRLKDFAEQQTST